MTQIPPPVRLRVTLLTIYQLECFASFHRFCPPHHKMFACHILLPVYFHQWRGNWPRLCAHSLIQSICCQTNKMKHANIMHHNNNADRPTQICLKGSSKTKRLISEQCRTATKMHLVFMEKCDALQISAITSDDSELLVGLLINTIKMSAISSSVWSLLLVLLLH